MIRLLLALLLFVPTAALAAPFASDRISVRVEGAGPDVVLVPGLTSSPSAWAGTVKAMPGYRWHLVQVKGFAGAAPEANATGDVVAPAAEAIARYIAAAGLKRPAVVGHSMGGTIALMIAARHPDLIGRAMVVDQVPYMGVFFVPPGTAPTAEAVGRVAAGAAARLKALDTDAFRGRMDAMTSAMVDDPAARRTVVAEAVASDRDTVANAFGELIRTDLRPELGRIAVPVTVLYVTPKGSGMSDAQIDAGYAASYAPLKGVRLVRVADSAHFIMSDNPVAFRRELAGFLGGR